MKSKLLIFALIITVILSVFTMPAMAAGIVEITRPEGTGEVVNKDIFSIFGKCTYDETTILLEYKDRDSDTFKPLVTTDGYSTFKVGTLKLFGKDIQLKYKGENIIRITSTAKDVEGKQVDTYTITFTEKKKLWWDDALKFFGIGNGNEDKSKTNESK